LEEIARTLPCKKESVFVFLVPKPPEPEPVVVPVVVDVPFFALEEEGFLACKAVDDDDDDDDVDVNVNGISWETVRRDDDDDDDDDDGRESVVEKAKTPIDDDDRSSSRSRSPATKATSLETPLLQLLLQGLLCFMVDFVCILMIRRNHCHVCVEWTSNRPLRYQMKEGDREQV
jgi:hypothetical protein